MKLVKKYLHISLSKLQKLIWTMRISAIFIALISSLVASVSHANEKNDNFVKFDPETRILEVKGRVINLNNFPDHVWREDRRLGSLEPAFIKLPEVAADARRSSNSANLRTLSTSGEEPVFNFDDRTGRLTIAGGKFRTGLRKSEVKNDKQNAARSFLNRNGGGFGLKGVMPNMVYHSISKDEFDNSLVKFRQYHKGVEILFGEARVLFSADDESVLMVTANVDSDINIDPEPKISSSTALDKAKNYYAEQFKWTKNPILTSIGSEPKLYVYSNDFFPAKERDHLVWRLDLALEGGGAERRFFIDAHNGETVAELPLSTGAIQRQVKGIQSGLTRTETSGSVGDSEVNSVFSTLGTVYNHFSTVHGWVSFDDNDSLIKADVDDPGATFNAFYNPSAEKLTFGPNMGTADIVGHEFMHGVTRHTANLWYVNMSGAMNESMSDIFGSRFDNDWVLGNGSAVGTIRDMANPASLGNLGLTKRPYPDHLSKYECMFADNGGVHINSSIINRAGYLMAQSVGRINTEKTFMHSLKTCLSPTATFTQLRDCTKISAGLYGATSAQASAFSAVGLTPTASNPFCGLSECLIILYVPPPAPDDPVLNPAFGTPGFADLAYFVRDNVFEGTTFGNRYTSFWYQHGSPMISYLQGNSSAFSDGASLISSMTPHLMGFLGYSSEPTITTQFRDDMLDFLLDAATAPGGNAQMQADILNELWYLNFFNNGFVGKTFNQAWNDLPNIWHYSCPIWECPF